LYLANRNIVAKAALFLKIQILIRPKNRPPEAAQSKDSRGKTQD
jgi:hypothetical protein